jgi:hypothetical protein
LATSQPTDTPPVVPSQPTAPTTAEGYPQTISPAPVVTAESQEVNDAPLPTVGDSQAPDVPPEGDSEEGMLPDPPSEPTGIIGIGAKMLRSKTSELAESERVKQAVQKAKEIGDKVAQSQSAQFVKTKTTEILESERVQKGIEYTKEKAAVAATKASEVKEKVSEKTKEGLEYAREKTKSLQEGAKTVWSSGRGSISKVRASVSNMAWKGSARDTLDIAAREEQWKGIKVQGAEELSVPARTEHTCCYSVKKGETLRWTFRVKEHDVGFGVRMRIQAYGGAKEEEVLAVERYDSADTISGSWVADEDRMMVLVFDNKYSKLRGKTVAYYTGTEKPPVFVETTTVTTEGSVKVEEPASTSAPKPIV